MPIDFQRRAAEREVREDWAFLFRRLGMRHPHALLPRVEGARRFGYAGAWLPVASWDRPSVWFDLRLTREERNRALAPAFREVMAFFAAQSAGNVVPFPGATERAAQ